MNLYQPIISGSLIVSGSITVTDGITGSISNAISASYAATASYALNVPTASVSSSYALTASYVETAQTASYVLNAVSSSYALTASSAINASASLISVSSSYALTASYLSGYVSPFPYSGSAQVTGSLIVSGSSIVTGSLNILGDVIATSFTGSILGTASTASYVLNAVSSSYATSAPFYVLTASYNTDSSSLSTRTTNLESTASTLTTASASFALVSASFSSTSGSLSTRTTNLESTSSTLTTASASFASSINSLQSVTGSYATTGSNTFTGTNNFNIVTASYLQALSASIDYLYVIYQTSSVIYSSGSNIFGDNANDTQTLWGTVDIVTGPLLVTGSVNSLGGFTGSLLGTATSASFATTASFVQTAQTASYILQAVSSSYALSASYALTASSANSFVVRNSLTASGLRYPTTDGAYEFQVLQTDSSGDLSFGDVSTTFDNVYNGEATTLIKGTPVYISGSQGANPKVYAADAADANKMPVVYIVSEEITSGNVGRGITLGHIEGIDLTGYAAGTSVYVAAGGGWTSTRPTGSNVIIQFLGLVTKGGNGGKGLVLNPGPATLPNIQTGYTWVGDSNSYPTALATSSLLVSTASYSNTSTSASYALSSSLAQTASYVLNAVSSSYALSASFATFALSASNAPGTTVNFTQATAIPTWSFTHNLNTQYPIVQVYDATYSQIIPNAIVGTTPNTVEIRFDYSQSGYAVASNGGGLIVTGSMSQLSQSSAAVTWSFTHNLNSKYVNFEVYDSNNYVVIPSGIQVLTTNTAEIYFAAPSTGIAVANFSGINGAPNATSASYALTASYANTATSASYALTASYLNPVTSGYLTLTQVSQSLNYSDDTAAAAGGVPLGGLYRNGNFILIRIS